MSTAVNRQQFEKAWELICECEGQMFHTITHLPFTYRLEGDIVIPSRTIYNLSKKNFLKAYLLQPKSPGEISGLVRGSSYVWAILNDSRIGGLLQSGI
jgi:hypothetical protein